MIRRWWPVKLSGKVQLDWAIRGEFVVLGAR
jgi:hypothetical protein